MCVQKGNNKLSYQEKYKEIGYICGILELKTLLQ